MKFSDKAQAFISKAASKVAEIKDYEILDKEIEDMVNDYVAYTGISDMNEIANIQNAIYEELHR